MRQAGRDIGGTERGELLLGIDVIAVLLREAAGDRDGLAVGEQETGQRRRQQRGDVGGVNVRQANAG